jgi:hypothetical protein
MDDFLANPGQPPDASCLENKQPAAFVPADAITVPMLGMLGQLDSGLLIQIGAAGLLLLAVLFAIPVWFVAWLIQSGKSDRRQRSSQEKRLRRAGRLLAIAFGLIGMLFAVALTAVLFIPLLEAGPMASMLAVSGSSWPIFAAAWLLVLLALGMVVTAVLFWRQDGSVWGKLYYSFLALCAAGYVLLLGTNGLLTVLF